MRKEFVDRKEAIVTGGDIVMLGPGCPSQPGCGTADAIAASWQGHCCCCHHDLLAWWQWHCCTRPRVLSWSHGGAVVVVVIVTMVF